MFEHLAGRAPGFIDGELYRRYAVLAPYLPETGELLFQVRARELSRQPGEICFPGGRMEEGETSLEAALRETAEELLVEPASIEPVAPLDIMVNAYSNVVYPHFAILRDYRFTFNRSEVQEVFTVPLRFFLENEPKAYECRVSTAPGEDFPYALLGLESYPWGTSAYPVLFYVYRERVIWGMTAKFVRNLAGLLQGD